MYEAFLSRGMKGRNIETRRTRKRKREIEIERENRYHD